MILKKDIEGMSDGTRVNGLAVIQNVEERLTRNQSSTYLTGNLQCCGAVSYKIWSNAACFNEVRGNSDSYTGSVCDIIGRVNVYEGQTSIVIESCRVATGDNVPDAMDFYESKYDGEKYWNILRSTLQKNCSDPAVKVFDLVMKEYKGSFMKEFAAVNHHDNCKSGLIGHTTKLMKLEGILNMYPEIVKRSGGKDVLYIGGALHDIGKVFEYHNGSISNIGRHLCHTIVGTMVVSGYEKEIVNLMGEEFYLNLISIISCHSGEYGEKPRTVAAYVIHLLDTLESQLASLEDIASSPQQLYVDGFKLN